MARLKSLSKMDMNHASPVCLKKTISGLFFVKNTCHLKNFYHNKSVQRCGMEQMAARWAHNPKVGGSSPSPAILLIVLNLSYIYIKKHRVSGAF